MDDIDIKILKLLQEDSRISYTDLSNHVGISETAVRRRVKKLIDEGIITKFTIKIDTEKIGKGVTAFVGVDVGGEMGPVAGSGLLNDPAISELYTVTGDFDLLIKVTCKDVKELEGVIERVRGMEFTKTTRTHVVLRKLKEAPIEP
ncbi:MAG: Lrp/AsnC family transcriptional regulator [Candidatus Verstraetearchaeota archaeon]|nr:Lrp/AsnC family transcriptional regulator [Candidatus Verstraetearchaeota archaeon]